MKKKSTDEFSKQISNRHFDVIEEYINNRTPIGFYCYKCNHTWKASPGNIIGRNSGCPRCAKERSAYKRTKKDK